MRFPVHIDPWWRPLLLAGGATTGNSYVELTEDHVLFHFGLLFRRSVPRGDVESARIRPWPFWYGVGWRTNFVGLVGLIGSYRGVVEVQLRKPVRAWGLLPCRRITVSLQNPDAFVAVLRESPAAQAPAPRARRPRASRRPRRTSGHTKE